jgi:hypothetical protein
MLDKLLEFTPIEMNGLRFLDRQITVLGSKAYSFGTLIMMEMHLLMIGLLCNLEDGPTPL